MSTYHEPQEWLQLSIDSILNQTYTNLELIIVVDAPDNQRLIKLVKEYEKKDNRVKVLINNMNRGLVFSLNRALAAATGKYIARMDADDISELDRLEKQKKFIEAFQYDLVGSEIVSINEDGQVMAGINSKALVAMKTVERMLSWYDCIVHPTWFAKKDLFDTLDGYRNIGCCEDYDFLLRAVNISAKLGNVPEVLLRYRYNFSGISRQNKVKQRSTAYYIVRNRKHLENITQKDIDAYFKSPKGIRELQRLKEYFVLSNKVLTCKTNKKTISFGLTAIQILLSNPYGIKSAVEMFYQKILLLLDKKSRIQVQKIIA
ncbi:glycosyl transferase GT2 family [Eubacterium limosum]|nr:glycosyl transferase GT2 family [Eubacterium limosum]